MKYWETYFYAVSRETGEVKSYPGMHLMAESYEAALQFLKLRNLDYINLTGNYFETLEQLMTNEKFYKGLSDPRNIIKDMTYDDFIDWLDLAETEEDLLYAKDAFKAEEGLEEYVKIIESQIKHRYGEKKKKKSNRKKDDSKEDTGEIEDTEK